MTYYVVPVNVNVNLTRRTCFEVSFYHGVVEECIGCPHPYTVLVNNFT